MSVFAPYGRIPNAWPTGITQSRGPNGQYLQPYDPQYNIRGEQGFFHDTPLGSPAIGWFKRRRAKRALRGLGAIPTDFELAKNMGYTPVTSGWIATEQGYLTPPWLPPNGYAQGGYPPPVQPNDGGGQQESPMALRFGTFDYMKAYGLGDAAPPPPASVEDVLGIMNAHNDRVFALSLVSTAAVAVSAIITIFRTLKLIREGD